MSTLLEKLAQKKVGQKSSDAEKTASVDLEQIFSAAFVDELEKLGYETALIKQSGAFGNVWGSVKNFFSSAPQKGGQLVNLKKLRAASAMPKGTISPTMKQAPATTGGFQLHEGDPDKRLIARLEARAGRSKTAGAPLIPAAIGIGARLAPLAARALPAIGRFAKGLFGAGKAVGTAGKAGMWTGRAGMASSLVSKKSPQPEQGFTGTSF